jgi:hypothetical protein
LVSQRKTPAFELAFFVEGSAYRDHWLDDAGVVMHVKYGFVINLNPNPSFLRIIKA